MKAAKRRKDGMCFYCERRPAAKGDPFCSSKCARFFYGAASSADDPPLLKGQKPPRTKDIAPREFVNVHRNRDRHEGPQAKRVGMRG